MRVSHVINGIRPDPIRYWAGVGKDAGVKNNLTIGVPDPMPDDMLGIYAEAANKAELSGKCGYPPFSGEPDLKENIIRLENNFGAGLSDEDVERLFVTVGASQALTFVFSLFPAGSDILVNSPCWGTIHNMIAHSGNTGVPAEFFRDGRFIKENADARLTQRTVALYVNYPANPTGQVISPRELRRLCEWAVSNNLEIITDEPYKYLIFNPEKTPYVSPAGMGSEIAGHTSLVSSFSKIVKPDIRLGFIRLSAAIMESHDMIGFFFRNLSAGAPRSTQAGVSALLDYDPNVGFLRGIVEGYRVKSELARGRLQEWGCRFPYEPNATYMMFPTTPDASDSEEWVRRTMAEQKTAFIPGTSFGGQTPGFEHLRSHFRIGFGGAMSLDDVRGVLDDLMG
jgi:aspartate/methionine/tyrosine aminotransferase